MNTVMPKVNLLFVITKLELGGAQRNVLDLAAGCDRGKFNIFLFTCREGLLMEDTLAIPGVSVRRSRFLCRSLSPVKDLLALIELFVFIRRRAIDIVHTHSSKAGIIGRIAAFLAGTKAVCHTVHGWPFNDRQFPVSRFLYTQLEKCAGTVTRAFIVVSDCDRQQGLGRGIGSPQQYSLVRYGIDRSKFTRSAAASRQERAGPVIGTVACLKPQKAPHDFIRLASVVCRDFPQARFVLAGDGVLRAETARQIRALGLERNVTLCGWRRDIPEFLASLDVFCLTSLWEGLPIAVIEAMASALPVVCTDTGGVRELIAHGTNGFIVPRGDMEGMAALVTGLCRDGRLRADIGRAAAASLGTEFDMKFMIGRTERIYAELMDIKKEKP
jgi:glycosyltransferase involved in cell wall biosynthesis